MTEPPRPNKVVLMEYALGDFQKNFDHCCGWRSGQVSSIKQVDHPRGAFLADDPP
jgi:hypothetical protein